MARNSGVITAVLALIGVSAALTGCESFASFLNPQTEPPDPLALAPGYELSFLRVDIRRGTHPDTTVTITNPDGTKAPPKMKENDYGELVVDFGNGIVLDSNNNLSVDLLRLYGMEKLTSYHIVKLPESLFDASTTYDLGNGVFTSKVGLFGAQRKAVMDGNQARVESGLFDAKKTIGIGARSVELATRDLFGQTTRSAASLADDGSLRMNDLTFAILNPDHVGTPGSWQIERVGDRLRISVPYEFEYSFLRIKGGVLFYPTFHDQDNHGFFRSVEITKEGSRIRVKRGGQLDAEYEVTTH